MRPNGFGNARFIQLACPFLIAITHSALLDCLSIDTYVDDLYNFISGSGGTRALPFFQSLSNSLSEESRGPSETNTEIYEDSKTLLHEDLPSLVESMKNASKCLGLDNNSAAFHTMALRVAELQGMIRRTQGVLMEDVDDGKESANLVVASTYPRDIQLSGNRHDKDKRDITEISVLPTKDEIRSECPEFLPSPNVDQPHFLKGVERHLNTHFRLRRHDIFVKSLLGGLLNACENEMELVQTSRLPLSNMHAHTYSGAYVKYLLFTTKSGLEVQISFRRSHHVQKKSSFERRRWWEDTKRMEEGSLLCLFAYEGRRSSLLFFTLSQKITGPKGRFGLVSDG